MSILIVEDNPVNATLLETILEKNGYHTLVAHSAKDALEAFPGIHDLQLIITDLGLPEMNGLEFIATVKKMVEVKDVPIIVVSTQSDISTVTKASSLQCSEFLVKPIERKQLLARVETLLRSHRPILQSMQYVMNHLGIEREEYDSLVNTFAAQLGKVMSVLVLEQGESGESISDNLAQLLKEITESANVLGAERFLRLYAGLKAGPSIERARCSAVLRSLQELDEELKTRRTT